VAQKRPSQRVIGAQSDTFGHFSRVDKHDDPWFPAEIQGFSAGVIDVLSNTSDVALTPDGLRKLGEPGVPRDALSGSGTYRVHRLSRRLETEQLDEIIRRYQAGMSATALAREAGIAPSALLRLLRERNVVIRQHGVPEEVALAMGQEYEAGATKAELQEKFTFGAVLRALHRSGVEMRAKAPRRKLA
jgi:hypothetical protein